MCQCKVCSYYHQFNAELAKLPEATRPFFEQLYENYAMQGADLNYANAVISGAWPSADEVIACARERFAKAKAARTDATTSAEAANGKESAESLPARAPATAQA